MDLLEACCLAFLAAIAGVILLGMAGALLLKIANAVWENHQHRRKPKRLKEEKATRALPPYLRGPF